MQTACLLRPLYSGGCNATSRIKERALTADGAAVAAQITIKDVTESSRGSFAGTIVSSGRDEKLVLSPQYQNL